MVGLPYSHSLEVIMPRVKVRFLGSHGTGKLVEQEPPLKRKDIWMLRVRLQMALVSGLSR